MIFEKFDLNQFWEKSEYADNEYVGNQINRQMIEMIENKIGYKLPESYLELLKSQNGGIPKNTCAPANEPTSWSEDHVAITGIFGLDMRKSYSLLGELGSDFMKDEWEYPDIGIYICDCPSAGHDMIALDYTLCGSLGEPRVVHVDQELDYKITPLSENFEEFIRNLVHDSTFDYDV